VDVSRQAPALETACLSCGGTGVTEVVSLGDLPLANACPPLDDTRDEPRYPLTLGLCADCALVQLRHVVRREALFSDYLYFSSYSRSMLQHAQALAAALVAERRLGPDSLVVEIASNDGYLLQYFQQAGVPVLGIEPARNIAAVARDERGIPTVAEFFTHALAERLRAEGKRADVVLGLNVLAHVDDVNGFVRGMATILSDEGVAVIEVPYVRDLVDRVEFDTIYHEHLFYFSIHAVAALVARHGLVVQRVDRVPVHGGSLRLHIGRGARHSPEVQRLLDEERAIGLTTGAYFTRFRQRIEGVRETLGATLTRLKTEGATVAAYGAAAKGAILLNYCGIGPDRVAWVADRSPHKQGRRMPGCRIPIVDPSRMATEHPDYVLLLVWNLRHEILTQESAYRAAGGKFIVPLPEVEIV
jgi:SAM-dependent methyltransferase